MARVLSTMSNSWTVSKSLFGGLCAILFVLLAMVLPGVVAQSSQRPTSASRNIAPNEPALVPTRTVRFTTEQSTWSSVDVSPDGRRIIFDLLGDLYTVPIAGGKASRITTGPSVDLQPRFSPDGMHIAFLSDRSGDFNVWIMASDGGDAKQLTRVGERVSGSGDFGFIQPSWTPDSKAIVVSQAVRIETRYDLVAFNLLGESIRSLIFHDSSDSSVDHLVHTVSATFTPDSKAVYATQLIGTFNGIRSSGAFLQIVRIDPLTGKRTVITDEVGGAFQPLVSPDGRHLAYASTYQSGAGLKTGLKLLNLVDGRSKWLVREVEPALVDHYPYWSLGLVPNFSFTPDGKAVVASYKGTLWRIEVVSGRTEAIPFSADVEQQLGPLIRFPLKYDDSNLTPRIVRDVRISSDRQFLAFVVLDGVWVMNLKDHGVWKVPAGADETAYSPAWSPDGRYLAYVTWSEHGGYVNRIPVTSLGEKGTSPERVTAVAAYYDKIAYAPGGETIALIRAKWQDVLRAPGKKMSLELSLIASGGGPIIPVFTFDEFLSEYGWPHFSRRDTSRIFLYTQNTLWAISKDGLHRDPVMKAVCFSPPGSQVDILLSPDGKRALIAAESNISLISLSDRAPAATVCVDEASRGFLPRGTQALQLYNLLSVGGEFPSWSDNGNSFAYSLGRFFFSYDLARGTELETIRTDGAPASSVTPLPTYEPDKLEINITVAKDKPRGTLLLSGGRIITMRRREVIESGDILIRDNRIAAVGVKGAIPAPAGTYRLDVSGKTILPGYILTHEHVDPVSHLQPQRVWQYLVALAYGVTTVNDPQASSTADKFTCADRVETGSLLGPRHVSTGTALEAVPTRTYPETLDLVRRYSRFYDSHMLKDRDAGNRRMRQWIAIAAREEGLTPVAHWKDPISHVLDGFSGIEHATPFPWYDDLVQLLARSGTIYTPTTIAVARPNALGYFQLKSDFTKEEKLWTFTPPGNLEYLLHPQFSGRSVAPKEDYSFKTLEAPQAAKLVAQGGLVGVATDGVFWGLGAHWEMWVLAMGGMPPYEVVRSATLTGAKAIGMDGDLGSIETGKLADLQILDRNPLNDIQNTNSVHWVMKNGRLYEAGTLNEVWPRKRPFASGDNDRPWWWDSLPPWHPDSNAAGSSPRRPLPPPKQ